MTGCKQLAPLVKLAINFPFPPTSSASCDGKEWDENMVPQLTGILGDNLGSPVNGPALRFIAILLSPPT